MGRLPIRLKGKKTALIAEAKTVKALEEQISDYQTGNRLSGEFF